MSNEFKDGVQWFEKAVAQVPIYFPNGIKKCVHCEHLYWEKGLNRARCYLTKQIIFTPNFPELPDNCPAKLTGEIIGHKKGE